MKLLEGRVTGIIEFIAFLVVIHLSLIRYTCALQQPLQDQYAETKLLSFSRQWQSLGPFRIGTREAIWGADPLEAYGGFTKLSYDDKAFFRSPLTANAAVHWALDHVALKHISPSSITAEFDVQYSDVDWAFLQSIYGWSALQFQTWTRGEIFNHASHTRRALIYPKGILEFHMNDLHVFGGDFYTFSRAPVVVDLKPGKNTLNLRLIRDVRAMGGHLPPNIEAQLTVEVIEPTVHIDQDHIIAPDLVDDILPSLYMSVPIINTKYDWICLKACNDTPPESDVYLMSDQQFCVAPGQSRPIPLKIRPDFTGFGIKGRLCYHVGLSEHNHEVLAESISFSYLLARRHIIAAHKFTFLHPSGAVSYAIIKAPQVSFPGESRPLLVNLHGAGLEADSHQVRHMLDAMPDLEAFSLFPTGMSPWSGDDWHIWGMADVLAGIDAVHDWLQTTEWNGTKVTTNRVLVSGHSNGGQGTWFFASHLPDRTLAAVPASGYTSIENYVSFNLWHEADPIQSGILHTARASFKHELLTENLLHIPLLQQHGSGDDNVPPYHSRLMSSLRAEFGGGSDYVEVQGQGHWWDGAMTTAPLQHFYRQHLSSDKNPVAVPLNFVLVSFATDEVQSKFGIEIELLLTPTRLGRVEVHNVTQDERTGWQITTTNVLSLAFKFDATHIEPPDFLLLDSSKHLIDVTSLPRTDHLIRLSDGEWIKIDHTPRTQNYRTGAARGNLDAIMRTRSAFSIVSCVDNLDIAIQISRNMLQYFGADSNILSCDQYDRARSADGNVILITKGPKVQSNNLIADFPITFSDGAVLLRSGTSGNRTVPYQAGLGGIFLRPRPNEGLELIVWGYDSEGLGQAARLVATLTGGGQPDFIFLGRRARWLGHGGTLAMGFLDYRWHISHGSYLP